MRLYFGHVVRGMFNKLLFVHFRHTRPSVTTCINRIMWCFFYEPHRYALEPPLDLLLSANRLDIDCLDPMLNGSEPSPTLMLPSFKPYNISERAHGPTAQALPSMGMSSKRVPKSLRFQPHGVTLPFSQRSEDPLPMQYGDPSAYTVVQE